MADDRLREARESVSEVSNSAKVVDVMVERTNALLEGVTQHGRQANFSNEDMYF